MAANQMPSKLINPCCIMKTKLNSIFIGLAMLAGAHPVLAQTELSISSANNQVVISWPTSVTNYVLQSTTNLAAPNWATVSNAVLATVSNAVPVTAFIVTSSPPANFFRLIQNTNTPITTPDGMALIPTGSFTMGDTLDGETDAVPVSVAVSAFYMDTNLVSYSQWQSIYSYATSHGYSFDYAGSGKGANHPVQTVNWYDCVKWCNARSQQAGLTPVYYTDKNLTHVYTTGDTDAIYPNWTANGYRLPTEAEWEKAARGGLSGLRFPWGNTISESQANYLGNTNDYSYDLGPNGYNTNFDGGYPTNTPYTSPVGYFAPNGYGLYDMAGNLFEWCWDWYAAPPYPAGSPYLGGTDPTGPAPSGFRVLRSGYWANYADKLRCANRINHLPVSAYSSFGFRCVRRL